MRNAPSERVSMPNAADHQPAGADVAPGFAVLGMTPGFCAIKSVASTTSFPGVLGGGL